MEQADDYIKPNGVHEATWLCECSCEEHNRVIVRGWTLNNNRTQSCGCIQKECARKIRMDSHKTNNYSDRLTDEYGDYYIGWTTNTNKEFYIDADDFDKIKDYCWSEAIDKNKDYHWLSTWDTNLKKNIKMHQLIVGKYFDHEDRNPLNNRKYNLRKSTHSENTKNRGLFKNNKSGVTGVSWMKNYQMWSAYINIDKKRIYLGFFVDKMDAIISRLKAEKEYYGEFAPQRHLFKQYNIETTQN